jgi:hypothetical protein
MLTFGSIQNCFRGAECQLFEIYFQDIEGLKQIPRPYRVLLQICEELWLWDHSIARPLAQFLKKNNLKWGQAEVDIQKFENDYGRTAIIECV